jgi:selenocysteine-specific elongation factor
VIGIAGSRSAFAGERIRTVTAHVLAALDQTHADAPDNPGLLAEEIATQMPGPDRPVLSVVLDQLLQEKLIARSNRLFQRAGHVARLSPADAALYAAIRAMLEAAGRDQPRLVLLAEQLGRDPEELRPLLDKGGRIGWLGRISKGYHVPPAILAGVARAVAADHPERLLTVGRFREAAGIGRNLTMPLLEFFDAQGLTTRIPEGRCIRPEWRPMEVGEEVVPQEGFEPPTPSLRMRCSTS